jgi:hypothetical protein
LSGRSQADSPFVISPIAGLNFTSLCRVIVSESRWEVPEINFLSPLEKYDYESVQTGATRKWRLFFIWLLIATVSFRLFVKLPDEVWHIIGFWCVLLGAYIAFLWTPYLAYHMISRRVKDGTIHFEIILPFKSGNLLTSKLRSIVAAIVSLTWPLFLIGWVTDPGLGLTGLYLASAYYLPVPDTMTGLSLLALTLLWYGSIWALAAFYLISSASRGESLIGLMGRQLFFLGAIFTFIAVLMENLMGAERGQANPGLVWLVVIAECILASVVFLIYRTIKARMTSLA